MEIWDLPMQANVPSDYSGESVTVDEIFHDFVIHDEPLKVVLENTISDTIAEFFDERIQTTFGGFGLMITIKDFHVGIRNLCDFVAVKTNNRDASFGVKVNRSVARLPVDALLNSGTHFRFDLTHERKKREGMEKEKDGFSRSRLR